ncbi:MAG: ABC transporter ATP-binding protein [Candidatus Sumerlaeaceae bacterium]|nr:ABC transporter ATP-binding protein [Candidatus Sumerlaeaceae bacterium]
MPLLEINNLTKSFAAPSGEKTLIVDVPSFSLEEGAQVALEGASGSGKTTFLNLIAGILQADGGTIRVAGQEMTALAEPGRDRLRAATIGYVFQTFNLLQGYTALENVALGMAFGRGVDGPHALALLQRVGLNERMTYRPRQLSVGQQQRVAVARALANRPRLVLADEPTGNLDRHHAREALKLIREVCRENGAALLLVSHDHEILGQFEDVHKISEFNRAAALENLPAEQKGEGPK